MINFVGIVRATLGIMIIVACLSVATVSALIQFPWDTTGDEKAEALRTDLKWNLAAKFRGLEYIEPLER